jgi:hypothetical protein
MYRIALVLDEGFGRHVIDLAQEAYVWLVQSEENDRWADVVWKDPSTATDPLLHGVSTFARAKDEQTDDLISGIIEMIDEHHGECAHDPAWSEIDVIGAVLSPQIEETARSYGVDECQPTPQGFRLIRGWQRSSSARAPAHGG